MELQRYGFLSLLCVSLMVLACSEPGGGQANSSAQPPASPSYDWNKDGLPEEEQSNDPCGLESPSSIPSLPAGIVGGEEVQNNNWLAKGTVFLTQAFRGEDGRQHTSICTASLIDTNLILTAAHCVDQSRSNLSNLSVYFTARPECESENGTLQKKKHKVAALRIHPLWDPEDIRLSNRGDLALLRISGKAPSNYKPLRISSEFIPISSSTPILIVGFGMVNPNYYGNFGGPISLRVAQAPGISEAEKQNLLGMTESVSEEERREFDNQPTNEMLYIDQSQGRGICGGDSGGPSLMKNANGEDVITGVASFVMNPEDPKKLCGYVAAHTSVIYHKDWLARTFQELRNQESQLESPFR